MNKRWSDFLFAFVVRVVCGSVLGAMAGLLFGWRMVLRRAARDDGWWIALWFLAWATGGALVAVFTMPYWKRPWYKGVGVSDDERLSSESSFKRVRPELYNRMVHPSPKQFHDFVQWLREVTVSELERARGNPEATKAALGLFFRRGLKAELLLGADGSPSIDTHARRLFGTGIFRSRCAGDGAGSRRSRTKER